MLTAPMLLHELTRRRQMLVCLAEIIPETYVRCLTFFFLKLVFYAYKLVYNHQHKIIYIYTIYTMKPN